MIMLEENRRTNHLLYRFDHIQDAVARRRVFDRLMTIARINHQHILPIEHVGYDETGRLCVVTAYPGNQDGLVTLPDLLEARGGTLDVPESTRLISQLLVTSVHASEHGIVHADFDPEEILIDRHGCPLVELFGLEQAIRPSRSEHLALAEQTRSIARLGLRLIAGTANASDAADLALVHKHLDRAWDAWFRYALDPVGGFDTPAMAIASLPGSPGQSRIITELKPASPPERKRFGVPSFRRATQRGRHGSQ